MATHCCHVFQVAPARSSDWQLRIMYTNVLMVTPLHQCLQHLIEYLLSCKRLELPARLLRRKCAITNCRDVVCWFSPLHHTHFWFSLAARITPVIVESHYVLRWFPFVHWQLFWTGVLFSLVIIRVFKWWYDRHTVPHMLIIMVGAKSLANQTYWRSSTGTRFYHLLRDVSGSVDDMQHHEICFDICNSYFG